MVVGVEGIVVMVGGKVVVTDVDGRVVIVGGVGIPMVGSVGSPGLEDPPPFPPVSSVGVNVLEELDGSSPTLEQF
jgi:hypothetical protein